jgi:DNA-binding NtrC family response regulator
MSAVGARAILLVDDEESIRSTAARVLRRGGFAVITAASAEEAGEIWGRESGSIGVLVTDVELGGIDGVTLAARCLEDRPGLPVVLTSGYAAGELRARRPIPEGCRFLAKPFTAVELMEEVRPLLESAG